MYISLDKFKQGLIQELLKEQEKVRQGVLSAINSSSFSASMPGNLGTNLHLNGSGCLPKKSASFPGPRVDCLSCITHTVLTPVNLGSTGISKPCSSRGLMILNTVNTFAMTDHTDVSAKCLPTHMRRPNPNAICSTELGLSDPSSLTNRSGMNACGSEYLDSSCAIPLAETDYQ